mgnify:CR=1 FL=1
MLPLSSLLLTLASLQSEVMEAPAKQRPETDVEQESVTDRSIEGGEVTKRTLQSELADTALKPRERAVHLLSRLSYHPTPADLAEVERIGIVNWVDRQLQPGRMENARFQHRISELNGINMTPGEAFAWAQDGAREAGQLDLFYKAGESVDLAELIATRDRLIGDIQSRLNDDAKRFLRTLHEGDPDFRRDRPPSSGRASGGQMEAHQREQAESREPQEACRPKGRA